MNVITRSRLRVVDCAGWPWKRSQAERDRMIEGVLTPHDPSGTQNGRRREPGGTPGERNETDPWRSRRTDATRNLFSGGQTV